MTTLLYLADLTYTQQGTQSEIMPNAIGCVGAWAKERLGDRIDIRIFKRPDALIEAIKERTPDVMGFSNYAWNEALAFAFAKAVKTRFPEVVTIFGGPNFPLEEYRQTNFLNAHPEIDYYVVKEGEIAFANLLGALLDNGMRLPNGTEIRSVHYIDKQGTPHHPESESRIRDLSAVPSPYLLGWMDEFFEGFWPIIHTNRGCPFSCTFCVEGTTYYNKVYTSTAEKVRAELEYIARRMEPVIAAGGRADLFIADSNFGMYKDDVSTAEALRDCQNQYGWPKYISVATGKNQKERVLKVASLVQGALRLSGSVQSLDEGVLENIKRKNVSADQIMQVAVMGSEIGANTYSEVILGLPGDTKKKHFDTIARLIQSGFNRVETYTLMLLHGSELNSPETREKFQLQTKFRVIPRCFGYFDLMGTQISVGEIEEVVVANSTMSFEEYVECRVLALIVVLFHNDGFFESGIQLLNQLGIPVFDCISRIVEGDLDPRLQEILKGFSEETRSELWDSREDLEKLLKDPANVARYVSGDFGSNLIFKYKTMSMLSCVDGLGLAFAQALKRSIEDKIGALNAVQTMFVDEMMGYAVARAEWIFINSDKDREVKVHFDIPDILERSLFLELGVSTFPNDPTKILFQLDATQRDLIQRLLNTYGTSIPGLTRGITRTNLKRLLRQPVRIDQMPRKSYVEPIPA